MITVSCEFHNAPEIVLLARAVDGRLKLSTRQAKRVVSFMWDMNARTDGKFKLTVEGATVEQLFDAMNETGV